LREMRLAMSYKLLLRRLKAPKPPLLLILRSIFRIFAKINPK